MTMRLWILRTDEWDYDEIADMAVVAPSEAEARAIADAYAANPPRDPDHLRLPWSRRPESTAGDWADPERTTCVEVPLTEPGVALEAVHHG